MRVLLISNLFPPAFFGGYELAAQDVARMLVARGHAVTILSSPDVNGMTASAAEPCAVLRTLDFINIRPQPTSERTMRMRGLYLNLRNLDRLRAAIEAAQPDIVLCFNLAGLGVLGILRLLAATGLPTMAVLMDDWFQGAAAHPAELASFRQMFAVAGNPFAAARLVGCSRRVLNEVGLQIGADLADAVVIPAWVECSRLIAGPLVCDTQPRFLFASRIAAHKGVGTVVEAAAILQARGIGGFTVDLVGAGSAALAVQHAHAHRVDHLVRYLGAKTKPEMLRLYHGYDALLFPTWEREPSGFVVSEAAASGCVPVMTATMGGAEFALDGHDCIKVALGPGALADAMHRFIVMPPAARLAWRSRVRRNARRLFDAGRWYDRLEAMMCETAAHPAPGAVSAQHAYQAIAVLAQLWRDGFE